MKASIKSSIKAGAGAGLLPVMVYPATMVSAISLFFLLRAMELPLPVCAYLPLLLGAATITCFEFWTPHRRMWRPGSRDVLDDALFMVTVQMVLPQALGFLAAVMALQQLGRLDWHPTEWWPHSWPMGLQAVLMVLAADFLRYWLHRFSHESPFLWRFHAVHHSPKKLYWLNVGRFHPLEKTAQFMLDALPFLLVGVPQEVLALYFVFYGVNGFFQHCNIELRMGFLNYIISGPQLHRWHHSRRIVESNTNYGNNIIIWDLVFGTYFFPRNRYVDELGLINPAYPPRYLSQLKAPFSGQIDKEALPLQSMKSFVLNLLLKLRMRLVRATHLRALEKAAERPEETQARTLRLILERNAATEFGRFHDFPLIDGYDAFKKRVPVRDYDGLQPWIERQERERAPVLTAELPFMYNRTSGTTGREKFIPVLRETIDGLKRSQAIALSVLYRICPEAFAGKILGLVSPAVEGRMETGTPYGSASGHLYESMPVAARLKYVLPEEVFAVEDYDVKYYLMARVALEEKNITYIGSANPATFSRLLDVINGNRERLLSDIQSGGCERLDEAGQATLAAVRRRLRPNPHRAAELSSTGDTFWDFGDIWPYLKLVSTWTGGSCGVALKSVRPRFPENVRFVDIGYLASELRGTITINPDNRGGVPTLGDHFFEFVARDDWEHGRARFLTLGSLESGREYYLFVTTSAGLYRYDMNDIIRVTGRFRNTPTLEFVQKGKGVTNIVGEKLYESQVIASVDRIEDALGIRSHQYQMLADEEASRYDLYMEPADEAEWNCRMIAGSLDDALKEANFEYAAKRVSGRLHAPVVHRLKPGAFEAFKRRRLGQGQREGQFKPLILCHKREFDFPIHDYCQE